MANSICLCWPCSFNFAVLVLFVVSCSGVRFSSIESCSEKLYMLDDAIEAYNAINIRFFTLYPVKRMFGVATLLMRLLFACRLRLS